MLPFTIFMRIIYFLVDETGEIVILTYAAFMRVAESSFRCALPVWSFSRVIKIADSSNKTLHFIIFNKHSFLVRVIPLVWFTYLDIKFYLRFDIFVELVL